MTEKVKRTPFAKFVRSKRVEVGTERTYSVRRETNEEIMTQAILNRGEIRMRVTVQIQHVGGQFVGYHGASFYTKVGSIKEARELVANLKKSLED